MSSEIPGKALPLLTESYDIGAQNDYRAIQVASGAMLGEYYLDKGSFERSQQYVLPAHELAKKTLKTAIKYELTDVAVLLLSSLLRREGIILNREKIYKI